MKQPPKILLIDDDPLIRRIIGKTLQANGYEFLEAASSADGVEVAKTNTPDLILLDLMMPGMDGFEVCERLRSLQATSETPIIMLTALDQTDAKIRGLQIGADDYITKPFNLDELQTRIMVQLRRQGSISRDAKPALQLQIFLCHSSDDKAIVRDLYRQLSDESRMTPWLDEENLLPGQEWDKEIPKQVQLSDVVLVCLSKNAVQKSGYVQKEIRIALDVADEKPEGTIFIIPVRLEDCTVPDRLRRWQWVDYFEQEGYEKLLRALRKCAKNKQDRLREMPSRLLTMK